MTLIRAEGLSRRFPVPKRHVFEKQHQSTALEPTDLEIAEGESLGLIGESGSGKSTLVRLLLGLDRPSGGRVIIDGRDVDATARARSLHWLRRQTGLVFQDPYASLDPRMTAGQIIAEPLWALDVPGDHGARVRDVLVQVGLDADMADRHPHEFSGGQRQRIAIARAIAHRPRILVGDEPMSALDVTVRAQVLALFQQLRAEQGLTLIVVSHDIGLVQNLSDTVAVMKDGRIVERGTTAAVLQHPREDYTRQLLAAIPSIRRP
ncbi:ATP-binding cassette domain-containing protein [Microbacterium esteraromaticum]|uniref:ABC transporter ATP-binding protein n=1 Tax=Microbacterium esteraromaticum TaxID=57043 RepID=UPI001CD2A20B|nr:ATP-binding cassette domain-containing protein [Microbacterium esteraromaticum]MCA1305928.1 ATP-binding cassette domain-containing protein [Microbacterium esteraromaticum]